jgi:hypothetical protein
MANADALLTNIKDRAAIPPAAVSITDPKLLTALTEELQSYVGPVLDGANDEYFTTSQDTAIVSGQAAYDLPARAASGSLRALKFVDANGVENPTPIPRIELPDIGRFSSLSSSYPVGFYFTATQVVVVPTPSAASGSLRMFYSRRPGTLVNGTSVVTVTGISDTVVTAALVTTSIFAVGQTVDVSGPNHPFKLKLMDAAITASNGTTITIGAGGMTAAGVAIGDYVTIAQTSYVPQIPLEWHALLELRGVARVFAMLGNMNGRQEATAAVMDMQRRLLAQSNPRSAGNSKKISAWR